MFNYSTNAYKSSAAIALLLFVCVDLLFRGALISGHFDRFEAANHRWTWWQAKGYKELPCKPDVVLLGSSLMTRIVNEGEATYLKRPINVTKHNRSRHFEDNVRTRTGLPITTYAFGLAGLHASDAAVLVNGLMRDKTPSTLIYTIAPRDFMDNLLETPSSTEQFELMSHISDVGELGINARLSHMDKFTYCLSQVFGTLFSQANCKYDLSTAAERQYRRWAVPILDTRIEKAKAPLDPAAIGIRTSAFDYPESLFVTPENPKAIEVTDNLLCYHCCYQPFRQKHYNAQIYYLESLLRFARDRGVDVVLVNMPLRKDNLTVMGPDYYQRYKSDMTRIAAQYGARFVDMFDSKMFPESDFCDTVHLTGHGAIKFVDKLSEVIAPYVASSVQSHGAVNSSRLAGKSLTH